MEDQEIRNQKSGEVGKELAGVTSRTLRAAEADGQSGQSPTTGPAAIYYEGLERIWRLADLTMERKPTDIATLQGIAHHYMARGNVANAFYNAEAATLLFNDECRAVTLVGKDYWAIPREIYDQLRALLANGQNTKSSEVSHNPDDLPASSVQQMNRK